MKLREWSLHLISLVVYALVFSQADDASYPPHGTVLRLDEEAMSSLIALGSTIEILYEDQLLGTTVYEGPVWRNGDEADEKGYLLFSDVKGNKILMWQQANGISVFLDKSGCYTDPPHCSTLGLPGTNGLFNDPITGDLVMNEHGERLVARLNPNGTRTILASHYQGKRINSPNDLTMTPQGDLFFTDPPYGLVHMENDSTKELDFGGVFYVPATAMKDLTVEGTGTDQVQLVSKALQRPNGIGLSPDGTKLYVGESTWGNSSWFVMDKQEDGSWSFPQSFARPENYLVGGPFGSNDGMKIDSNGNLWAAAPGGIIILTPEAKQLGLISTGDKHTTNLGFGGDGYLYLTGMDYLARIPVLSKPLVT